ncbi:cytochrome b [Polynucleobacter paneuropaeus]|nr:cytochrome b [Polynucleobacter paneuropaeus]MBT8600051.1 cytochrome b [Polynucleobacter paneuropaeus]
MTIQRYHPVLIFFHWFIFLLVVLALASIELKGQFIKGSPPRELCKTIHGYLGQLIFMSVVLRLFAKWYFGNPPSIDTNTLMTFLHKAMHTLLYCLLLLLPILGVIFLQAGDKSVNWLGWDLPNLVPSNPDMKKTFKSAHEWLGNALYYLIGLHAFSAIWQHYVLKNDTLQRMSYRRNLPS